jgi:hypothetical protein
VCSANCPEDVWNTYGDALVAMAKMTPYHFDFTADPMTATNAALAERNLSSLEDAQVWIRTTARTDYE